MSASLTFGAPLSVPAGGAAANLGGCILVNSSGIFFSNTPCTTPNVFDAGAPDTGSYTGLTGGTIQNLTGAPVVGNLPSPIVNFATFNTPAGTIHFDLVSTDPGFGTAAGCISNAPGSVCTLPGSPITLTQVTSNRVSITLGINGQAYLGSSSTGTSPTGALFTTQNLIPGTITGILAEATSQSGFQDSYSATFSSVNAPSTCPANTLEALFGTWTFAAEGFVTPTQPFASAGVFTASAGVNPVAHTIIGALTITNSASRNRQITRQETDTGTFQVFPGCSGGTLVFNLSANPMQFDFFFANGRREIVFTSTTAGTTITGRAWLSPPAACPANPLDSFTGMWTFSVSGLIPEIQHFAAAGQFTASSTDSAGNPAALITILDTSSIDGQLTRQSPDSGKFQILPDCSGGSLRLNFAASPMNFDFWFFNGGTEIVLIGTDNGTAVSGKARRT
ncbi:MAG: hypothetical protein ABUS51_02900 [Acidobacteriota bacterium]